MYKKSCKDDMYVFPTYWSDKFKIEYLQRVIIIHSFLYYETDHTLWNDRQYDMCAKQLLREQQKHTPEWIEANTQYGYAFYDYDASTGFHIWDRLNEHDKQYLSATALRLVMN